MKAKYILGTFFCASMALMGCSDDLIEDQNTNTPWQEGDAIIFGARGGFENNEKQTSRTIYNGGTYEVLDEKGNPHTFEKIEWVNGDNISIMCDQAHIYGNPGAKFADYVASDSHLGSGIEPESSNYGYTTFTPVNPNSALQWGSPEVEHVFYACYPTTATTSTPDQKDKVGMKIEKDSRGVKLTGIIPNKQTAYKVEKVTDYGNDKYTGYIARPIMRNAHMYAKSVKGVRAGETVDLTFKPIPTALEIELAAGKKQAATTILSVMIGSDDPNQRLAGSYQCYVDDLDANGYPKCNIADANTSGNQVLIPLPSPEEGQQKGIQGVRLLPGEKLRLTAFLLPHAELSKLKLTVITMTGRKSHAITSQGQNVTISAHKKHYVRNVTIPSAFSSDNWMSRLDDKVKLSQLSIPGTSNSYSYVSTKDSVYYKSQTLTIAQQWNMGTRCFEIKSDRELDVLWGARKLHQLPILNGSGEQLGGGAIVGKAVKEIWAQVQAHPSEFAVIIMNYQPTKYRDGGLYLGDFANYFTNMPNLLPKFSIADNTIKYDPNLPLSQCRGRLLFIVRPTSFGEGMLSDQALKDQSTKRYLVVNGWGSLQDQWFQRGYPVAAQVGQTGVNANSAADVFKGSMEESMITETRNGAFTPMVPTFPINFEYNTNNASLKVWAQDWNRVCPKAIVGDLTDPTAYVHWQPSYVEKLSNAETTFTMAINKQLSNTLVINCISGYFIDENMRESYVPARSSLQFILGKPAWHYSGGSFGNIDTYSQQMNLDFFTYMWKQWQKSITAPMGIVMMNRLGTGTPEKNPENFYMPNIVISNNFSFPLETVK